MANTRAGLDPEQVRLYIVRPALEWIDLWSEDAEELVLATAAHESQFRWVDQLDKFDKPGPAYGLWQVEEFTHDDIWRTFLRFRPGLARHVEELLTVWANGQRDHSTNPPGPPPVEELHWNNLYGAAVCRIRYLRAPGALPDRGDVHALARYWKAHYNTPLGKGTVEEFADHYELVKPKGG